MATQQRDTQRDNQNLQNTANQRFEELKSSRQRTSAGETSSSQSANSTNVDGRVAVEGRDVETFETSERNTGAKGDDRDSRNH